MEIMEVEEHYRTLLGKRRNAAAEMSAPIDLPSNKDDLELYALQMREDLLSTQLVDSVAYCYTLRLSVPHCIVSPSA